MNRERLLKAIEVLSNYDEDYDLGDWQTCAIGILCRNPWFRCKGLHLSTGKDYQPIRPIYQDKDRYEAVGLFFDVQKGVIADCFSSINNETLEDVVNNLKLLESQDEC